MLDLRHQPPVAPIAVRPETASQTLLSFFDNCKRSAYLYLRHKNGPSSHPMDRGSAVHDTFERALRYLIERDENALPYDIGKQILDEVIAERPELTVPRGEYDHAREMVYHWCEGTFWEPESILAVEELFSVELGGWTLRGKVDVAFAATGFAGERVLRIHDYKTSRSMRSQEAFEDSFQTPFYTLAVVFGTAESLGVNLGAGFDRYEVSEVYPALRLRPDGLASRTAYLSKQALLDFRSELEAKLKQLDHSFESGEWPAVSGAHCQICPARRECPIPDEMRQDGGEITTLEEAVESARVWDWLRQDNAERKKRVTKFARAEDLRAIPLDADYELAFGDQVSRVVDWAAVDGGATFDPKEHVSVRQSTPFDRRKIVRGEG